MEAATVPQGFAPAPAVVAAPSAPPPREIVLGDTTIPVYAQRHAYLTNKLGRTIQGFVESGGDLTTEGFIAYIGDGVYDVLSALLGGAPLTKRLPRHVFMGYDSEEAMAAGAYDEEQDRSPDTPQIIAAFEAVWKVNRFDVLGKLGTIVDPTVLTARLRLEMSKRLSTTSPKSPPPSGESDQTSSGTTPPTSTPTEG